MDGAIFRRRVIGPPERSGPLPELMQVSAVGALAVFRSAAAAATQAGLWSELGTLRTVDEVGMVAAVGESLRDDAALAGEVCREMAILEPMVLGAGGSALSVVGLYPQATLETVVNRLHSRFFREVKQA
jgi:aspartokinase